MASPVSGANVKLHGTTAPAPAEKSSGLSSAPTALPPTMPTAAQQPPEWSLYSQETQTKATYLNADDGSLMSLWTATKLTLDGIGVVEPTPFADGASGLMSLVEGDLAGVAGSAASAALPYAGDAVAKPLKIIHELSKCYDWADKVSGDKMRDTVVAAAGSSGWLSVPKAMRSLDNVHKAADEAYKNPENSRLAKSVGLPVGGPLPFAPSKDLPAEVNTNRRGPFTDAFGNRWFPPRAGATEPAFRIQLAGKSGLSSFSKVEGGPIYVDARGLPVRPEKETTAGHLPRVTVPTQLRKA